METITRPSPVGTDSRGRPSFDHEEVALYRQARAVTQEQLASEMGVSRPMIAQYEKGKKNVTGLYVAGILDVIDRIAYRREKMAEQGASRLELLQTFCRAEVGKGTRLERCGKPTRPGLVVCEEHIERHEDLVQSFEEQWIRRAKREKTKGATR